MLKTTIEYRIIIDDYIVGFNKASESSSSSSPLKKNWKPWMGNNNMFIKNYYDFLWCSCSFILLLLSYHYSCSIINASNSKFFTTCQDDMNLGPIWSWSWNFINIYGQFL